MTSKDRCFLRNIFCRICRPASVAKPKYVAKPKGPFRRPSASEQLVLEHLSSRLLSEPADSARCAALIVEHHYLHAAKLVGEHLRYAATDRGEWLAVVSFSAAAYHLRYRDQFIGRSPEQRRRRPPLVVNHARFLILPGAHYSNLASRLLTRVLARLPDDWQARWGHPVALVETFVDPEFFRGTTYKVSNWSELGPTSGFGRHAQDFYEPHERPKQLWVKQLVKGACQQLRAPQLPTAGALVETHAAVRRPSPAGFAAAPVGALGETHAAVRSTTPVCAIGSLLEECRSLPEFRRRQALAEPVAGIVALIVLATFCDVMRRQRDLAAFPRKLSQPQLRAARLLLRHSFYCDPPTGRGRCPGETAFFRGLDALSVDQVDAVLLRWQAKLLGLVPDTLIAIDGKTLRHSRGQERVNAIGGQSGRWLGPVRVADKSNKIPAA